MPAALDRNLYVPLYHQLKEILLNDIRSGKLKPDDRLPSEDQVAAVYGVSIITVRRTLTDLAAAGYIRRERGRGTFISHPTVEQGPRELTSFAHEMSKRGLRSTSQVLEQSVVHSDAHIAQQLKLAEGEEVFVLRRLRLADGEPLGIQTAYIPLALAPGLVTEDFASASLYETLQKKFGVCPSHAREVHSAISIGAEDAKLLGLPPDSVGFAARRLTYLSDGRPFEFVTSIMRGDRYEIVLDLVCQPNR
ncbi:MAG: transcriptional regulator, GntR family [Bryobacterales bacterium]|nr:transcriptional regulator, GntR family [Bryobacterales bacterium]